MTALAMPVSEGDYAFILESIETRGSSPEVVNELAVQFNQAPSYVAMIAETTLHDDTPLLIIESVDDVPIASPQPPRKELP